MQLNVRLRPLLRRCFEQLINLLTTTLERYRKKHRAGKAARISAPQDKPFRREGIIAGS
jgi:hypothetical protein